MGARYVEADVNALERLQMVRGRNSSVPDFPNYIAGSKGPTSWHELLEIRSILPNTGSITAISARAKALSVGLSNSHFKSLRLPTLIGKCYRNQLNPPPQPPPTPPPPLPPPHPLPPTRPL